MPRSVKKKSPNKHKKSPDRHCHKVGPTPTQARKLKEQAQVAESLLSFRNKHRFSTGSRVMLESIIDSGCIETDEKTWAEFIHEQQTYLQKQKTGLMSEIEERIIQLKNQMVELRSIYT